MDNVGQIENIDKARIIPIGSYALYGVPTQIPMNMVYLNPNFRH